MNIVDDNLQLYYASTNKKKRNSSKISNNLSYMLTVLAKKDASDTFSE
jgi:hypothetical protein